MGRRRGATRRPRFEPLDRRILLAVDLIGSGFVLDQQRLPMNPVVSATYSITNQGSTGFRNSYTVGFYLSDDATITTSDTLLKTITAPPRAAGGIFTDTVSLTLPATDPYRTDNDYFIGMVIDINNDVFESNENNNANADDLQHPHLDRDNISSEASLPELVNGTDVVATPFSVGADVSGTIGDEWIGSYDFDIYSFNAVIGHTYNLSLTAGLSATMRVYDPSWSLLPNHSNFVASSTGSYDVVVSGPGSTSGDPRQLTGRTAATVSPYGYTFSVVDQSADLIGSADLNFGSTTQIFYDIMNLGPTNAPASTASFYLSDDNVLSTSTDILLGTTGIGAISGYTDFTHDPPYVSGSLTVTGTSTDPFRTDNEYYLITVVDSGDAVPERNETNNVSTYAFSSERDLPSPLTGNSALGQDIGDVASCAFGASIGTDEWIGPYDQDIYNFALISGEKIGMDLDLGSGSLDSYFRLYDSSWSLVASNDNGAAPGETLGSDSYLEYTNPATTQTFHLVVSSASNHGNNPLFLTGRAGGTTGAYTVRFDRFPTGPISGTVFDDHNGNGVRDAGEGGISGRIVYVDQGTATRTGFEPSATTDANGNFTINGLIAGTYHLREDLPSNWLQSAPADGQRTVTATTGQQVSGLDFADLQRPVLSGTAFDDANADGLRQPGEAGVPGLPVYVDVNGNGARDTQTMVFNATGLPQTPSTVIDVPVSVPGGPWVVTDVNVALNLSGCGGNAELDGTLSKLGFIGDSTLFDEVSSLQPLPNVTIDDQAAFPPIDGTFSPINGSYRPVTALAAFDGIDPNGTWRLAINYFPQAFGGSRPGQVDSFSIALTLCEPQATTDANGNYSFTGLAPGPYAVREESSGDWIQTSPAGGAWAGTAAEGQTLSGLDFGNFSTHRIGTDGNDTFRISLGAGGDVLNLSENDLTYALPRAEVRTLSFEGGAGDDTLIVDASGGNPVPPDGIDYNGGADSGAPGDSLQLVGDMMLDGAYTPSGTTAGSGIARIGGLPITFAGLEPVLASTFGSFTFTTPNSSDALVIDSLTPGTNDLSGSSGGIAFETLTFSRVGQFTLDCGANDTVAGASGNDSLTIFDPGIVATAPSAFRLISGAGTNGLTVNGGAFELGDGATSTDNSNLILNLNTDGAGNASISLIGNQRLAGLHIGAGGSATVPESDATVLAVASLSIASAGLLDLSDSDLIVRSGVAGTWNGSAYDGITGMIESGAILSSGAQAKLTTLGVATAGQIFSISGSQTASFDGQTVSPGDVLVKFTYVGDANLDGKVNIDDYGRIDGNVGASGSVFGWFNGDFNYDGKINIDDYGLIDSVIGTQGPVL